MNKPVASLSLDLDDKWSYLRTHGSAVWEEYPSYLRKVVPTILTFLDRHSQKITFFVVGRDAAEPGNSRCLREIVDHGHDVANHSMNHEPWLHLLKRDRLEHEILGAKEAIFEATARETTGFRGPGYSISETHLDVLSEGGFFYDASAFPNILNPLARAYFFAKSNLSDDEKRQRKALFGNLSDAFRPIDPFTWELSSRRLLEVPVTTMPLLRLPCHFSYVLYLSGFSEKIALLYFRLALGLCRMTGTGPSLLLHPLDFLGAEDEPDLGFFPGMNLSREHKLGILDRCLHVLKRNFRAVTMAEHVDEILANAHVLNAFRPKFNS